MNSFDFSIDTPEDRVDAVRGSIGPSMSKAQLSAAADYILFVADANQTKRERLEQYPIVTRNRAVTISKREVSAENLGKPGVCSAEEAMSALASPDVSDSPLDRKPRVDTDVMDSDSRMEDNARAIANLESQMGRVSGKRRFELKRQIISKYQERHIIRESISPRSAPLSRAISAAVQHMPLDEEVHLDPVSLLPTSSSPVSLYDEGCVLALLSLKRDITDMCEGDFQSDVTFMLMDLDREIDEVYGNDPFMSDFVSMKVDHIPNCDVARYMRDTYGISRSEQYYSTLWNVKVPKAIVNHVRKKWLLRHYTDPVAGKWKVCSKCGRRLLAHPMFFSRNTSRDGYYSVCKRCRSEKRRENEQH